MTDQKSSDDKMSKRLNNIYADQELPTHLSVSDVKAMKNRISELEMELANRKAEPEEEVTSPSAEVDASSTPPKPAQPTTKSYTRLEIPAPNQGSQKQIALWSAGIFSAAGLAFSIYSIYVVVAVQAGRFDLSDKVLMPFAVMMFLSSLLAFRFIQRERLSLGMGILFFTGIILPPVLAVLMLNGMGSIGISYLVLLSFILISLVMPKNTIRWAILAAATAVLFIIGVEYWSPTFRINTAIGGFVNIITAVTALVMILFVIRQAATGNITTKLVTAFVVMSVLSMGAIAYQSTTALNNSLTAEIINNHADLATSQGFQIGQAVNNQYDKLKSLSTIKTIRTDTEAAKLDETRPQDVAEIEQLNLAWRALVKAKNTNDPLAVKVLYNPLATQLRQFQDTFPENTEILITDEKGFSIASTNLPLNYYQADTLWWRTAKTAGQYIGQPTFDLTANTVALDMAIPIYSYTNNEFVGVLRATVNFNVLSDLLVEGLNGKTGYTIIYQPNDQQINLQLQPDGTYKIVQDFAPNDLQEFIKSPNPNSEFTLNGISVLASAAPVRSYTSVLAKEATTALDALEWRVIVVQEKSEALQPVNAQTRINLILVIVVILLVIVVSYFLAGFITNPIVRLNAVANRLASGDLTAEAKIETRDEVGTLAGTFNRMTSQLRETLTGLEERVADRTRDLELAAEVGRNISAKVENISVMLTDAAELIRARFNLYYTQVYITEPSGNVINLRAGTGEVGRQLLNRGHHLSINSNSLNGRAASEKRTFLVSNTANNPSFLPNPLLPKTRSEMSVPLIAAGRVVGVLDMQSEQENALNSENQPAFEAMAGQLAIAIQNAALFEQTEKARQEVEDQSKRRSYADWVNFLDAIDQKENIGFAYSQNEVTPIANTKKKPDQKNALHSPITISGAEIGSIHISDEPDRVWTSKEAAIMKETAAQLARQIENLRLLAQSDKYRLEAEQITRRLTREGWSAVQDRAGVGSGFIYDLNEVKPFSENGHVNSEKTINQALLVRNEKIGELSIENISNSSETTDLLAAVAEQLSSHIENLRLSELNEKRAREMETVATVSSTASTVLDPDNLLQAVVDLTKERFGLYHAHVYLADEKSESLLLSAGAGAVGRMMKTQGHAIPSDMAQSLVARAYRERRAIIVNNVADEPGFLPNPALPQTLAEMALPMIVGETVLGIFDVQSQTVNNFTEEDATIYTTLATQVAVALQNARLYVEQAATVTQLRELDRLKSSFLANMSHELRTPLNSILGFTDVMLEELDGPLTPNMDNDLKLIQKNGKHLLHLINDVLDMAKIESGKMNLVIEKFNLNETIEDVMSITSSLANEKSLGLFIEPESDQNVFIRADHTRLRQVFINLINNGVKFTDKGSVSIRITHQVNDVLVSVKDTGLGIPTDHLETVFSEFTQVDSTTTRKAGGTGLGLPISRRLIEMHGGKLWAESNGETGNGSVFKVLLPIEAVVSDATVSEPLAKQQ